MGSEGLIRRKDSRKEEPIFAVKISVISGKTVQLRRKRGANNLKVKMMNQMVRRKNLMQMMKSRLSSRDQSVVNQDKAVNRSVRILKTTRKTAMKVREMTKKRPRKKGKRIQAQKKETNTHQLTTDFQAASILRLKVTLVNLRKRCVTSTFVTRSNRGAKTLLRDSPKITETATKATTGTRRAERGTIRTTGSS